MSDSHSQKVTIAKRPAVAGRLHNDQPIIALSSGGGRAALAVLRMTGDGCLALARDFIEPMAGARLEVQKAYRCQVKDPASGEVLDDGLALYFEGPRSFSGQDTLELFCHGSPYIVQRVLSIAYQVGFRAAEPGEFTRRAFLNGKMDLVSCEGVKELIDAQSHQQWLAARQLATGRLSALANDLRNQLIGAMALLEARIDFPEEGDVAGVGLGEVAERVRRVQGDINRLVASYDSGRIASQGLKVVILGPPNAGKSTLMNQLLGHERAIVTPIAGTTRDYLEEQCLVEGRLIRLIDTAGVRATDDTVEKMGVEASLRLAREADIVLLLAPADGVAEERLELESLALGGVLKVMTKSDLGVPSWAKGWLAVSSCSEGGLQPLYAALAASVDSYVGGLEEQTFVTSARHLQCLHQASQAVAQFFSAYEQGSYDECLAFELQEAAKALAALVGAVDNEDILEKIFSEFCVGK